MDIGVDILFPESLLEYIKQPSKTKWNPAGYGLLEAVPYAHADESFSLMNPSDFVNWDRAEWWHTVNLF